MNNTLIQKKLTKQELEKIWHEFGDVPINRDEKIDTDFYHWEKGTDRFDIWHWFDEQYPGGVALLTNA